MASSLAASAHAPLDLGLGHAAVAQAVGHVVVDAHVRIERVVLEHHGDVAVGGLHLVDDPAADGDGAAGDRLQAGDHAQQRGLAAARRPQQHRERAVGNGERHALHGLHAAGVDLASRSRASPRPCGAPATLIRAARASGPVPPGGETVRRGATQLAWSEHRATPVPPPPTPYSRGDALARGTG